MEETWWKNLAASPMKRLEYYSNFRLPRFKTNKTRKPFLTQLHTRSHLPLSKPMQRALKSTVKIHPNLSETKVNKQCCKWSNECSECIGNLTTTLFSNFLYLKKKTQQNPRNSTLISALVLWHITMFASSCSEPLKNYFNKRLPISFTLDFTPCSTYYLQ